MGDSSAQALTHTPAMSLQLGMLALVQAALGQWLQSRSVVAHPSTCRWGVGAGGQLPGAASNPK